MAEQDLPEPAGLLAARALDLEVSLLDVGPSTSMEAHEAKLGVVPGSLCKTLVVRRAEEDYVLVVVPGGRRMDWPKVRAALGVSRASMATAEQALEATGFAPGSITPLGTARPLPVVLDRSAEAFEVLALGSGRPGASLLVDRAALVEALDATVADVTSPA